MECSSSSKKVCSKCTKMIDNLKLNQQKYRLWVKNKRLVGYEYSEKL